MTIEEAIKILTNAIDYAPDGSNRNQTWCLGTTGIKSVKLAIEALKFQQSVVKCGECIHHSEPKIAQRWWCNALDISVTDNDFCSMGERRGD